MKEIIDGFLTGVLDSSLGFTSFYKYIKPSKNKTCSNNYRILKKFVQCCALNGIIFWSSIVIFNQGIIPILNYLFYQFVGDNYIDLNIWNYFIYSLKYLFTSFWVLPLFMLSKFINCLWFQDIADEAFKKAYGKSYSFSNFGRTIADVLFSLLQQTLFLIQCLALSLFPIKFLTNVLQLIHFSLLYSIYSFEYKWYHLGFEIDKRLRYVEKNWPYFLGFGMPLAFLTYIPSSYIVSGIVFSLFFPIFILSANESKPINITSPKFELKIISSSIYLSNLIIKILLWTSMKKAKKFLIKT